MLVLESRPSTPAWYEQVRCFDFMGFPLLLLLPACDMCDADALCVLLDVMLSKRRHVGCYVEKIFIYS